jgi:Immunity protein 42
MLFGKKEVFAIECEIEKPIIQYVYANTCMWAGGRQIGDQTLSVMLYPVVYFLKDSLRFQGKRKDITLDNKSSDEIINIVRHALIGDPYSEEPDDRSYEELRYLESKYEKFCICPNGSEAFDGWFAILLEGIDNEKIIWWEFHDNKHVNKDIYEVSMELGSYDSIVTHFLDWVEIEIGRSLSQINRPIQAIETETD